MSGASQKATVSIVGALRERKHLAVRPNPVEKMKSLLIKRYVAMVKVVEDLYRNKHGGHYTEHKNFMVRLHREAWLAVHKGGGQENRLYAIWSTILLRLAHIVNTKEGQEQITLTVCPQQTYGLGGDPDDPNYPDRQQSPDFGLSIIYAEDNTDLREEFFGIVEVKPCVDALPDKDLLSDKAKARAVTKTMEPYYDGQLTRQARAIFDDYPLLRMCYVISAAGLWARCFGFGRGDVSPLKGDNAAYEDDKPTIPSYTTLFCILTTGPSEADLSLELKAVIRLMADNWRQQSSSKHAVQALKLGFFDPPGRSTPLEWVMWAEAPVEDPSKTHQPAEKDYRDLQSWSKKTIWTTKCAFCRTRIFCTKCNEDYPRCTTCGHPYHPISDCPGPDKKARPNVGNDKGAVEVNDDGKADERNELDDSG